MNAMFRIANSRYSYANRLSKRILNTGHWRAALKKQLQEPSSSLSVQTYELGQILTRGSLLWIIAAFFFGGILHIAAILSLPHFATKGAWARLMPVTQVNKMLVLPADGKALDILPALAPDVRYALCRYDISDRPVRVRVPMPNKLWSIAIYNPFGENFYTISGADLQRGTAELLIVKNIDEAVEDDGETRRSNDIISVLSPEKEGLVVIRAPLLGIAQNQQTDRLINKSVCSAK